LRLPSYHTSTPHVLAASGPTTSFAQWHHRLGHLYGSRLSTLIKSGCLGSTHVESSFHCKGCHLGKQIQLLYFTSDSHSAKPFDLIHSDVWGPAPFVSKGGHKYYVIFIDDHSRYSWIYFMKRRSELPSIYKSFTRMVHTQFSATIKIFRSDSGGEFLSDTFCQLLTLDGTLAQLSCPGAHAQNGVAERKHRHIIESARTILISSFVPSHFWSEAVSTAVYLINRQPSSKLSSKSPGEVLFGTPPRYDHLCVFGCICYVLLPPHERTKLTAQSVEYVFLGYSPEHKSYRCYDPSTRRIQISRDVSFNENRPFFHNQSTHSSYYPTESTSFMCLPSIPASAQSPSISTSDVLIPITPPSTSTSSSSYSSKPPVIQTYIRRSRPIPTAGPDTDPVPDSCIDNNESNDVFNQGYRLRDRGTIEPPDCYGFPRAGVAIVEPTTYQEASRILEWQLAMIDELAALERTGTWDIVPLPSHVVPITCKWVFKVKTKSDGSIDRYKARLVARGFQQTQGLDYDETFAPVAHMTTVRTLIAVAASSSWTIFQMDVKNAFLNDDLHEEVYMHPPPGVDTPSGHVCRLRRALYGLKQAPRAWFERFISVITTAGFFF
jgi:transposase InsO family protein